MPEVWGSVYDVRNLLNATVMLRDGKPITDMKLNPIERGVLKQIVKKLDSTDIPTLLKEYGVIRRSCDSVLSVLPAPHGTRRAAQARRHQQNADTT